MKYLLTTTFILCGVVLLCNGQCNDGVYEFGVSVDEQNYIVSEHNNLRMQLANGEVDNQPRAIDLKRFYWDDYLAGQAQNIANSCHYGHQDVSDSRWSVGQNIYGSSSTNDVPGANWTAPIYSWWSEHELYTYPDEPTDEVLHYTQMAWNETEAIGCGYTYYPAVGTYPYEKFYVCNYAPAGNSPRAPYTTGVSGCEDLC